MPCICFARAFPDSLELFLIPINHYIYIIFFSLSSLISDVYDVKIYFYSVLMIKTSKSSGFLICDVFCFMW